MTVLCRVLEVSRAAYYQFLERKPSKTVQRREEILAAVKEVHQDKYQRSYGSPRMHEALLEKGITCCVNTVAKVMRKAGIAARAVQTFRPATTDSRHGGPIAPNRLKQQFHAEQINQVWLSDITWLHTCEGFTYLCAIEDLCSRKIVGWATSRHIDTQLLLEAFNQAVALRNPPPGLIFHSDRGKQYASDAFRGRLDALGCLQSMSRSGNCYDNAPMESFFKSYKSEQVQKEMYQTHEHATREAVDYIERFYNCRRLHSALGYQSPIDYEKQRREKTPGRNA